MIDSRIPLMGQQANILGAMAQGTQLAAQQNQVQRQGELQNLYRQHGAGIMSGDMNALGKLAQFDAPAALGVRTTLNDDRRAEAGLAINQERLQMLRDETARALAEAGDQAAAQREKDQIIQLAQQAEQAFINGDQSRWGQIIGMIGYDLPFDESGVAAMNAMKEGASMVEAMRPQPVAPMSSPGKVAADIAAGILPEGTPLQGGPLVDLSGANIGGQQGGAMLVDEKKGILAIPDPAQPNGIRYDFVPGGPADLERKAQQTDAMQDVGRSEEKDRQQNLKMGTTLTSIGLNIKEIEDGGWPVTGPLGALAATIDGTPASDFRNRTGQISTSAALSEVQNMRDNSPTGGAVGQLTDAEREAIGLSVTALNNSSSGPEYVRAAKAYRKLMLDIAHGQGNWELNEANNEVRVRPATQGPNPPRVASDADYNALPSGATFIAPDGTMRRKP